MTVFGKWKFLVFLLIAAAVAGVSGGRGYSASPVMREAETVSRDTENLLILGHDKASGLTDVVMLASFDKAADKLMLFQIPRDTYFASGSGDYKKINGACRRLGGAAELCDSLSEALGLPIGGYVEFDTEFVSAAVDFVGGVTLNVPCDMDYEDPAQKLSIHLKKGKQTLDGESAVGFIRYRSGYLRADLGRIDAQKLFLAAFSRAFSQKVKRSDIPRAMVLAMKHIKTDLGVGDMVALAMSSVRLSGEDITVTTLPGEEVQSEYSGAWYYILSRSGCEEALFDILQGNGFDPQGRFTDSTRNSFDQIYHKDIKAVPHSFASLEGEGIGIAQKGNE